MLSPLLANLYLHDLDREMHAQGYRMVRYADDFVILCATEAHAREALERVRHWVEQAGLRLHPDKTHIGDCRIHGQGFEFLGYRFEAGRRRVRLESSEDASTDARRGSTSEDGSDLFGSGAEH